MYDNQAVDSALFPITEDILYRILTRHNFRIDERIQDLIYRQVFSTIDVFMDEQFNMALHRIIGPIAHES